MSPDKIPAALIVTGPNIASQDLLFAQLGDEAVVHQEEGKGSWFVRLRSAEAPNLKATLRKIIRDVTRAANAAGAGEGEQEEVAVGKDVSIFFLPSLMRGPTLVTFLFVLVTMGSAFIR